MKKLSRRAIPNAATESPRSDRLKVICTPFSHRRAGERGPPSFVRRITVGESHAPVWPDLKSLRVPLTPCTRHSSREVYATYRVHPGQLAGLVPTERNCRQAAPLKNTMNGWWSHRENLPRRCFARASMRRQQCEQEGQSTINVVFTFSLTNVTVRHLGPASVAGARITRTISTTGSGALPRADGVDLKDFLPAHWDPPMHRLGNVKVGEA